jgi:hypothetical protein
MSFSAPRNQGNNLRDPQFGALLDRPFHAIELEDGQQQRDIGGRRGLYLFPKFEFDAPFRELGNTATSHHPRSHNVEFLSHPGPQNANEVIGVIAGQKGVIIGNFVGNPSAAGHAF